MLPSEFDGAPSASLPDLVGNVIDDGNLRLTKIIGRGAWGVVYLATSESSDSPEPPRQYAAKCISNANVTDEQRRAIEREIRLHDVCARASKSVLKVHKVVEDSDAGILFIISDYCPDGDLLEMILQGKLKGEDELIKALFLQILDAVETCHKLSIFHRDLKPENILCREGGKAIALGDFGFATTEPTTKDFLMGSEPFMSPEVRGGLQVSLSCYSSAHADIWALGVILMNLSCGCLPWEKASINDPYFLHFLTEDPDYLFHYFKITREVNGILKRIFTTDPRRRISIPELRKAIKGVKRFAPVCSLNTNFLAERYITDYSDDSESDDEDYYASDVGRTALRIANAVPTPIRHSEFAPLEAILNANYHIPPIRATPIESPVVLSLIESLRVSVRQPLEIAAGASTTSGTSSAFVNGAMAPTADDLPEAICDDEADDVDDDESDGPITPETHAIDAGDAAAALEDISDLADLGLGGMDTPSTSAGLEARWDAPARLTRAKAKANPFRIIFAHGATIKHRPDSNTGNDAILTAHPSPKRMLQNAARMMGAPIRKVM